MFFCYFSSWDIVHKFKLNPLISFFIAKVITINKTIEFALDNYRKAIVICTDSQSTMQALESYVKSRRRKSPLIKFQY